MNNVRTVLTSSEYELLRAQIAARRFDVRIEEDLSYEARKEYDEKFTRESTWPERQAFLACVAAREAIVDTDILLAALFPEPPA